MAKTNTLRNIVLFLLVVTIFFGIGYKYLEYSILKSLNDLNRRTEREEIALIEEQDKVSEKALDIFDAIGDKVTFEDKIKQYRELEGATKQLINNQENYINTLQGNRGKYSRLEFKSNLLVGRRGSFAKELLENQKIYYQNEIKSAEDNNVSETMFLSLIIILKDFLIMQDYDQKSQKSPETLYSQYFRDIAALEKYTRSDFKYDKEEKIKSFYPYGYESLNKYKDFFGSYYSVVKDFVAGDFESANYKYSRIQETAANLSVDFDKLGREGDDRQEERAKNIIPAVVNKTSLIKEFKENNLGIYPFFTKIEGWKEDLVLCQLYVYKTGFYYLITSQFPKSTNFEDLVVELSEVSPKTSSVDNKFDKNTIRITNDDKLIKFECTDKEDGRVFTFESKKN